MKYLLLVCTIVIATAGFSQNSKPVVLTGVAAHFNNQVEVQDMSETGELSLPNPQRFFVPAADGHFSVKFGLTAPNYFRIGRNILYLSPGDSLDMFIDYKDPKLAVFNGSHAKENEYLRETPFPKGGSFLEAGRLVKSTIDSSAQAVEKAAADRSASLSSYKNLDREFVRLETARIKADVLNSFASLETYAIYKWKLSKDSAAVFRRNFPALIAPYMDRYNKNFVDASLLKLVVYRDVVEELVKNEAPSSKQLQQVKQWMTSRDLAQQLKTASDRETKLTFEPKINAIANTAYSKALRATLDRVLILSNGDAAVDFTALALDNRDAKLSGLKGKLIYIDLWATWCGPCMEEMPAYEKLKERFKDNANISFVSLSIDDDKNAWQKNVQQRNAPGYQWLIDRAKLQAYNIISVPRSILVDQDFKVVEMNAALPSSQAIIKTLTTLSSR